MARLTTAARRYAEAAFELARRDNTEDEWARDLEEAAQVLSDEEVLRVVANPAVPLPDRDEVVRKLLGPRISPLALNLLFVLVRRHRVDVTPQVSREYARLLRRARGIVAAVVSSAAPLTDAEVAAVRERVERMTDARVELETAVDPSLIGGLTVQIGDRLLDASVRGRLERLREQLVAGSR